MASGAPHRAPLDIALTSRLDKRDQVLGDEIVKERGGDVCAVLPVQHLGYCARGQLREGGDGAGEKEKACAAECSAAHGLQQFGRRAWLSRKLVQSGKEKRETVGLAQNKGHHLGVVPGVVVLALGDCHEELAGVLLEFVVLSVHTHSPECGRDRTAPGDHGGVSARVAEVLQSQEGRGLKIVIGCPLLHRLCV